MNTEQQEQEQQQRIMVPPMRYPLSYIPSSDMAGNFQRLKTVGCFPTDEAKSQANAFLDLVAKNQSIKTWVFGYIPAPPHSDITRRVIGKDGYYFKMTTTLSEVGFIWHNRLTNKFLFWGPSTFNVVKAMNAIRLRIHKGYSTPPPPPPRVPYQHQYQIEDISDDEEEAEEEETPNGKTQKNTTNKEQVIQDIMNIYGVDRKGADEKINAMVKTAVVTHD
jgi:hypothetical protein